MNQIPVVRLFSSLLLVAASLSAQDRLIPLGRVSLDSLEAFREAPANWVIGGGVGGELRTAAVMEVLPGEGLVASPAAAGEGGNLATQLTHGDIELALDFLLPKDGKSGVVLQGRYELQLADSWLQRELTAADLGGIPAVAADGVGGVAPAVGAARAPGLWQSLQITFQAPRFDMQGLKIADARFVRVAINGQVVQEDVALSGPTAGAIDGSEVAHGPLVLQGGDGPVAFRNIHYKRVEPGAVQVGEIAYAWYPGSHRSVRDFEAEPSATKEDVSEVYDPHMAEVSGPGTFVTRTVIEAPVAGVYGFKALANWGQMELRINGERVAHNWEQAVGTLELTAGAHDLETRYVRMWGTGEPDFGVEVQGPEMAKQLLTLPLGSQEAPPPILLDPTDHTLAQRGFVDHAGIMRFSTISVGSPEWLHFSYDLAAGAPLKVWRGGFLDMTDMWHHRGEDQIARARGDVVELVGRPTIALLQIDAEPWPTAADPALREMGYDRDAAGVPTFTTRLGPMEIRDRIAPLPDHGGLQRTLVATGRVMNDDPQFMLAAASQITRDDDGIFVMGDREYYLEWLGADVVPVEGAEGRRGPRPPMAPEPVVRDSDGRQELLITFPAREAGQKTIRYNLIW